VDGEGREQLNVRKSRAWALVDHQFAHVFVRDATEVPRVADVLRRDETVAEAATGAARGRYHERSGEIVLVAKPEAWFAYYWWLDDAKAPPYARTVDIHRKPGYDPVELFIEMPAKSIPLNAGLVKGSHGYPATDESRHGVLLASDAGALHSRRSGPLRDVDVAAIVLNNFGASASASKR
jgi:hypothetical protein